MLQNIAVMCEENREILRSIQRGRRWATVYRIAYWMVIVILSVVAYGAIQPYLTMMQDAYSGLQENINQVKGAGNTLQETFDSFGL